MKKDTIIRDLHHVLFCTQLLSAPDNFDLPAAMAKAVIKHHGLFFKEKDEVTDSKYWQTNDVEAHFFDYITPGVVPTEFHFECICECYFDWALFEAKQPIEQVFNGVFEAIAKITRPYEVVAIVTPVRSIPHDFTYASKRA